MANIILGKVAITWKGEYNSSNTYYEQDVVSNGADTYICTATSTTGTFVTADWDVFAQGTRDVATTSGDLIYHNGTQLVRLPIGTSDQILVVDSITGLPTWQTNPTRSSHKVGYLPPFEYIAMNDHAMWVIMEDGSLRTWGYGGHYALGNGNINTDVSNPTVLPLPKGTPGFDTNKIWRHYAYGYFAIDTNGDLWSWGRVEYGVTGTGGDAWTPVNIMNVNNVSNAFYGTGVKAAEIAHSSGQESYVSQIILGTDGKVYGTGYNGYGQVGDGTTTNQSYFQKSNFFDNLVTNGGVTVTKLRMGRDRYTSCYAITSDNKLYVWGYNGDYQLGDGTNTNTTVPFHLNLGSIVNKNISDVFPQGYGTFILCDDNTLHFMGGDYYGNSGLGVNTGSSQVNATTRNPVQTATDVLQFITTPHNYPSSHILKTDGTVYATGYNGYGVLGDGTTTTKSTWTQMDLSMLQSGETVTKIFCAGTGSFNCFGLLTNQGRVYTCGYNGYGQLGLGDSTARSTLKEVYCKDTIVDAVFSGYDRYTHLMVKLSDGQLLVCGSGDNYAMSSEDGEEYYTLCPVRF